jgi:hypothetical protein
MAMSDTQKKLQDLSDTFQNLQAGMETPPATFHAH